MGEIEKPALHARRPAMAEPTTLAELPTLKLLLIGSSGVGKSAIVRRYTTDEFIEDDANATIGIDYQLKSVCVDQKWWKLSLWDTAGQERYRTLTSSYYRGAQGVVLVYDVTDRESFESLSSWLKELAMFQGDVPPVCLLVGNKVDLEHQRVVSTEEGSAFAQARGSLFVECSAKAGRGVDRAFDELVRAVRVSPLPHPRSSPSRPCGTTSRQARVGPATASPAARRARRARSRWAPCRST